MSSNAHVQNLAIITVVVGSSAVPHQTITLKKYWLIDS